MTKRESRTRRFSLSGAALGLLSAALTGTAAQAQQGVPTYRGPSVRQTVPRTALPTDTPRMGMLEFTPRHVESSAYITIVGGVARPMVIRSHTATVSLDAVIQRAGGLAKEATGAVTIVRHGQPRMNLFYTPGAGTTLVPGDTVILSSRPAALPAAEQARGYSRNVAIICHNVQPHPAILWVPESVASAEEIARGLGQTLEALPPRGVVLPTARPTISPTLLLPTGTSLYFDPSRIDRARLAQSLSSGLKFDEVVDFEQANASAAADLGPPAVPMSAPQTTPPPLLTPTAPSDALGGLFNPSLPSGPEAAPEPIAPPVGLSRPSGAAPAVASPAVTSLVPVPHPEPERVASVPSHRVEIVRDSSAVGASLERVVPDEVPGPQTGSTVADGDSLEAELAAEQEPNAEVSIVNRAAFGWGLAAGVLVGSLAGFNFWLRSRPRTKKVARTVAELPLTEESASIRPQPVHGKVVGDRRLAFDAPHERPASPHFAAAAGASRPPLVESGAKGKSGGKVRAKGATKESNKQTTAAAASPTEGRAATPAMPEGGTSASNGLLERVLRIMQRERGE